MLSPGGILAFVIPTSFLNAAYYAKIRNYMKTKGTILNIVNFASDNKFIETQQATIGLVFRLNESEQSSGEQQSSNECKLGDCKFSVKFGDNYIFTENSDTIKAVLSGSTTFAKMGISVKTGTVVWNQHKGILTDDSTKTLLIYNTNVAKTNTVVAQSFANDEKKQYILMDGATEPIICGWKASLLGREPLEYDYV
jgi:hypothetical protein